MRPVATEGGVRVLQIYSQVRYLPPAAAGSEHRRDGPEESDAGARAAARTVMWIYSRFPQEPAETPEVPGSGSARRG